jgi:hypothetical protein
MTNDELDANLTQLKTAQRQMHQGVHDLLNVLANMQGEMDLAIERARAALDAFYILHPEFRE